MKELNKYYLYRSLFTLLGFAIAVIVHGLIEIPTLFWANRDGKWNPFLGFESYSQFSVVDKYSFYFELLVFALLAFWLSKIAWKKIYGKIPKV